MTELMDIYPLNLARCVLADDADKAYIPGIYAALATLTEREQSVLRHRFKNGLTLQKTAEAYGITRERIRQIEAKALRKLRHPSRMVMMRGASHAELREQAEKYQQLEREYALMAKAFEVITAQRAEPGVVVPMAELAVTLDTPIAELDMSVRSYNCLTRAGKRTLRDIVEMTEEELRQVRNLGRKSVEEVKWHLEQRGLELKKEPPTGGEGE